MAHTYYNLSAKNDNIDREFVDTCNKITQIIVMSGYNNFIRTNESGSLTITIDNESRSTYTEELNYGYTLRVNATNKEEFTTELLKLMSTIISNRYLQKELLTSGGMDFRTQYNKPVTFLYNGLSSWVYRKLAERSLPYLYINILSQGAVNKIRTDDIKMANTTLDDIAYDLGSGLSYLELIDKRGYSRTLGKELENFEYILDTYYTQLMRDGNVSKLCYLALLAEVRYIENIIKTR